MYIPSFNEEKEISVLHALIRSNPLGVWATMSSGGLVVNHVPFLLHENTGEYGTLVGHVARANPVWRDFSTDVDSVVVFQGAQAYISPSWYPSKHQHGKAVPTWNYAVVHAYGAVSVIDEAQWLLRHVTELTRIHEEQQALPWNVSDAPYDYIESLLNAIVGIEITISELSGKWKIGQNRSEADRVGTVAGLLSRDDCQSHELAKLLKPNI